MKACIAPDSWKTGFPLEEEMKNRKFALSAILGCATALILGVGCGDEKDPRLSKADVKYLKEQRLKEQYGSGTTTVTVTTTSSVVSYVTVTNTVNQ